MEEISYVGLFLGQNKKEVADNKMSGINMVKKWIQRQRKAKRKS